MQKRPVLLFPVQIRISFFCSRDSSKANVYVHVQTGKVQREFIIAAHPKLLNYPRNHVGQIQNHLPTMYVRMLRKLHSE